MAYYSNSNYNELDPIYHQNLYGGTCYDLVQSQPSVTYPNEYYPSQPLITYPNEYYPSQPSITYPNEYYPPQPSITYPNEYDQYNYHPTFNYNAYDSAPSHSIVSYSASTFSEPKYIEHEHEHNFTISYSVAGEFNEPDFLEYNPKPYGGGYDITQHYGKSLPPSKEICYPLSSANSTSPSLDPSPLNKEDEAGESVPKSSEESKLTTINEEESKQATIKEEVSNGNETENKEPLESEKSKEGNKSDLQSEKGEEENESDLESEKSEEENQSDDGNNVQKGSNGDRDHAYEQEKVVPQAPTGYGLGLMDLCGSIYDYWPCLKRDQKGKNGFGDCQQETNNTEGYRNQWEGAADYIFGSSYPYSERRDAAGSYESVIYGYERHCQQESLKFEQLGYPEDSWEGEYTLH